MPQPTCTTHEEYYSSVSMTSNVYEIGSNKQFLTIFGLFIFFEFRDGNDNGERKSAVKHTRRLWLRTTSLCWWDLAQNNTHLQKLIHLKIPILLRLKLYTLQQIWGPSNFVSIPPCTYEPFLFFTSFCFYSSLGVSLHCFLCMHT